MKRILLSLIAGLMSIISYSQGPVTDFGLTLSQLRSDYPDLMEGWKEDDGKEVYYRQWFMGASLFMTNYYTMSGGKLWSYSITALDTGVEQGAAYFFFLSGVMKYYSKGEWNDCDVDSSIFRAAEAFSNERRFELAEKLSAEFHYPSFKVFLDYNPDSKTARISYLPD